MFDSSNDISHQLRLGVAGCGRAFERLHLHAIQKSRQWDLVATYDPLKQRRDWIRQHVPAISVSESFESMLEQHDLDAVLIATPPESHYLLGIQAMTSGLHVMVEKPMALSNEEASAMLQVSRQAKKRLIVGFNRRFRRPYCQIKEMLAIIPTESIKSISYRLVLNPSIWEPITSYLQDDEKGGGVLDDVVSHQVDLLSWILDSAVQKVSAKRLQGPDTDLIALEMTFDNGCTATCLAGHSLNHEEKVVVQVGSKTIMAHLTGLRQFRGRPSKWTDRYTAFLQLFNAAYHKLTHTPNITEKSLASQWSGFADAIAHPNAPTQSCDAESGLLSVKVAEACRQSLQSDGSWQAIHPESVGF